MRGFALPDIEEVSARGASPLRQWVGRGDYQIYDAPIGDEIALSFTDHSLVVEGFAVDADRLATAAFESASGTTAECEALRCSGWVAIRMYYAAYFAAQALMRIYGSGIYQLDSGHVRTLADTSLLYGHNIPESFTVGQYRVSVNLSRSRLGLKRRAGNSHECVWMEFGEFLYDLANRIVTGPGVTDRKQAAFAALTDLRDLVLGVGTDSFGAWLSQVRNKANYRHEYAAWFPYKGRPKSYEAIDNLSADWLGSVEALSKRTPAWSRETELVRCVHACARVVALCRQLVVELCGDTQARGTVFRHGALAFLNQAHGSIAPA